MPAETAILWEKQILFTLVGIFAMIGVCFADYTRIAVRARGTDAGPDPADHTGKTVLRPLLPMCADRWIAIPGGMAVKCTVAAYADSAAICCDTLRIQGKGMVCLMESVYCGWRRDAGLPSGASSIWMACVLFLAYLAMLGLAVWHGWYRMPGKAVFAGICAAAVLLPIAAAVLILFYGDDYQKSRLLFYLSPLTGAGPQDMISYAMVYVRKILGNSRLVGAGDAMVPDVSFLPELSDFLLVGVARYYGVLAAVLLAGILLFLLLRFLRISLRQKNQLGMLMGNGVVCGCLSYRGSVLFHE